MDLHKLLTEALIAIVALVFGLGFGYYMAPDKVVTVVNTDNTKKVDDNITTTVTKKYDPNTGKVTQETDTTKKDTSTTTEKVVDKTTTKEKTQKNYAIKVGAVKTLNDTSKPFPRVGAEVRLPFFNTWLGGEGDITLGHPTAGLYGRIEF